jgi:predicted nuclease of restriction endonuclease-like (RecB) superfamily
MVLAYWSIGREIAEEEQEGKKRADYGAYLLRSLSERLARDFGEGFSEQSLRNMRQFYGLFKIRSTLWSELGWSHYKLLIRVEDERSRLFYGKEAAAGKWSVRALARQIQSHYYERLLSSRHKKAIAGKDRRKVCLLDAGPQDLVKDPYVLEFLGLRAKADILEKDMEKALIGQIQRFLLELGRGFSFVARQQRMTTESKDFFVDLVFYNYVLKCFVLIDLKVGELTRQDIGQMDMYVRLYEDRVRGPKDNPTIGIILCSEKDETVVRYSILKDSKKLFASKYKLYLPTEKELRDELDRERTVLRKRKKSGIERVL